MSAQEASRNQDDRNSIRRASINMSIASILEPEAPMNTPLRQREAIAIEPRIWYREGMIATRANLQYARPSTSDAQSESNKSTFLSNKDTADTSTTMPFVPTLFSVERARSMDRTALKINELYNNEGTAQIICNPTPS